MNGYRVIALEERIAREVRNTVKLRGGVIQPPLTSRPATVPVGFACGRSRRARTGGSCSPMTPSSSSSPSLFRAPSTCTSTRVVAIPKTNRYRTSWKGYH